MKISLITKVAVIVFLISLLLRVLIFPGKLSWNVEQSFFFWELKKVAVDREISLIGTHFFSLVNGPLYRSALANWILAVPLIIFGFSIKTIFSIFLTVSAISMITLTVIAKKLFGTKSSLLVLIIYGLSLFVIREELGIWYAALTIPLSVSIIFFTVTKNKLNPLIIGALAGLGLGVHIVILWELVGIWLYWLILARKNIQKVVWSAAGLIIFSAPLILFNLRNNFMMQKGLINLLTGSAVEDKASFFERVAIALSEPSRLIGGMFVLPNGSALALLLACFLLIIFTTTKFPKTKNFILLSFCISVVGLIGLFYAGRKSYSGIHYIYYFIPLIVLNIGGISKELMSKFSGKIIIAVGAGIFIYANLLSYDTYQDPESLSHKQALANKLYSLDKPLPVKVKFVDLDVLTHDAVIYDVGTTLDKPYENMNLIEPWNETAGDAYVYLSAKPNVQGTNWRFGDVNLLVQQ